MVYEPREDSYLLEEQVKKYAFGKVLDVGTGSGIQAKAAVEKAKEVVAVDIDPEVLKQKIPGVKLKYSDLLYDVRGKFDVIIFNPPYLPNDKRAADIALDGGKRGYELLQKFLEEVALYLNKDGIVLIVFSSLTNRKVIDGILDNNLLEYELLSSKKTAFEELYVYKIVRSELLKELYEKGIDDVDFLAQGKRGIVYRAKNKIVKIENKESEAIHRIQNETKWLKKLNEKGIGPKLYFSGENYFVAQYVKGERIDDFVKKHGRFRVVRAMKSVLKQCRVLDQMKVNKEEMSNPYKHVLIGLKVTLIDFERMRHVQNPQNVTQFCTYIAKMVEEIDKEELFKMAGEYKKDQTDENFKKVLKVVK